MSRNSSKENEKHTSHQIASFIRHTPHGLLVLAVFSMGFILRGPVTAYAPIATVFAKEFNVDLATIGLLSGIPVFCFAAFAPLGNYIIAKKGLDTAIFASIGICAIGILMRSFGGFYMLLASTVIIGAGIAVGNIAFPLIAARDFAKQFAIVTGMTSAAMNIGSFASNAITAPLTDAIGWRFTLETWLICCALVALLMWLYILRYRRGGSRKSLRKMAKLQKVDIQTIREQKAQKVSKKQLDGQSEATRSRNIYKLSTTYAISFVFICQCFSYFAMTAWLPSIFGDLGLDLNAAGLAASFFQLLGILGSVFAGVLIKKFNFVGAFFIIATCWISLPLGMLFAPKFWFIWVCASGFAQGGNYIIMFAKLTSVCRTQQETRQLNATVQMSAYGVAGIAPTVLGALYNISGSWTVPLWTVAGSLALMMIVGIISYREVKTT